MTRTCRACGRATNFVEQRTECPHCGEPYGKVTFGLDHDNVPWQTSSDAARDAQFAAEVNEARRARIYDLASQPRDE